MMSATIQSNKQINIGILGAARIAPFALIKQARQIEGVDVVAVAEEYQDQAALQKYAKKHKIQTQYRDFNTLLADDTIDAVYLPLPISMHAEWALKAITAGKHVLCEKPLSANAMQAQQVHEAAEASGLVVAEAMHHRYHPMVKRIQEIIQSGELGAITHIKSNFSCYLPFDDFRFNYDLGGGALMDMGCYQISFIRAVMGIEPRVIDAKAGLYGDKIDRWMNSKLDFGNGCEADVFVGMRSKRSIFNVSMKITGERGSISILNFIKPEVFHRLIVKTDKMRRSETVYGSSTYKTQLASFAAAIRGEGELITTTADALNNQRVLDAIYQAAGLPLRGVK